MNKKMSEWKEEFFNSLNSDYNEPDEKQCLITSTPLIENHITLPCNHSFNYIPLYKEVINQKTCKKNYNLDVTRLSLNQIKCPYCRTKHDNLLPYVKLDDVFKIRGVNYPISYTMNLSTCKYILKSGKNKGKPCSKYCNSEYCTRHAAIIEKSLSGCKHILLRGKNKGSKCGKKVKEDGLCSTHFK